MSGVLPDIARWLNGAYSRADRAARGKREGIPVEVRYALRGTGYERTSIERRWTEVDVQLPPGYALALYVRRHDWTDAHQVERGVMLDVDLGDAAFDRQFLIEAAPAPVVRSLLGPTLRALLASHDTVSLTTEALAGRPVVRLAVATWLDHAALAAAIAALVALSAGVRDAYAALESLVLRDTGSPYRPSCDGDQLDAQRTALADEVAAVNRLRDQR